MEHKNKNVWILPHLPKRIPSKYIFKSVSAHKENTPGQESYYEIPSLLRDGIYYLWRRKKCFVLFFKCTFRYKSGLPGYKHPEANICYSNECIHLFAWSFRQKKKKMSLITEKVYIPSEKKKKSLWIGSFPKANLA